MNCLKEGLRNTSAGTVDYTDGADVRPPQRAISYEVRSPQIFSLWVVHLTTCIRTRPYDMEIEVVFEKVD